MWRQLGKMDKTLESRRTYRTARRHPSSGHLWRISSRGGDGSTSAAAASCARGYCSPLPWLPAAPETATCCSASLMSFARAIILPEPGREQLSFCSCPSVTTLPQCNKEAAGAGGGWITICYSRIRSGTLGLTSLGIGRETVSGETGSSRRELEERVDALSKFQSVTTSSPPPTTENSLNRLGTGCVVVALAYPVFCVQRESVVTDAV